jgi:hypothetical protein
MDAAASQPQQRPWVQATEAASAGAVVVHTGVGNNSASSSSSEPYAAALTDCPFYLSKAVFCGKDRPCGRRHNFTLYKLLASAAVPRHSLPTCPEWAQTGRCRAAASCVLYHPPQGPSPADDEVKGADMAPADIVADVTCFWDTENCPLPVPFSPPGGGQPAPSSSAAGAAANTANTTPSGAEVMTALEGMIRAVTFCSVLRLRIHAFHSRRGVSAALLRESDKSSLRTWGVDVVDCGRKAGAVDTAMAGAMMKYAVEHVASVSARKAAAASAPAADLSASSSSPDGPDGVPS